MSINAKDLAVYCELSSQRREIRNLIGPVRTSVRADIMARFAKFNRTMIAYMIWQFTDNEFVMASDCPMDGEMALGACRFPPSKKIIVVHTLDAQLKPKPHYVLVTPGIFRQEYRDDLEIKTSSVPAIPRSR